MLLEECIKCGSHIEIIFLRGISTVSEARHIRIAFLTAYHFCLTFFFKLHIYLNRTFIAGTS